MYGHSLIQVSQAISVSVTKQVCFYLNVCFIFNFLAVYQDAMEIWMLYRYTERQTIAIFPSNSLKSLLTCTIATKVKDKNTGSDKASFE